LKKNKVGEATLERGRATLCPPSQPANFLGSKWQFKVEPKQLEQGRFALPLLDLQIIVGRFWFSPSLYRSPF
jgi:hypothetical protein